MKAQKIKHALIGIGLFFAIALITDLAKAETSSSRNTFEIIYAQAIKHKDMEVIFGYETDDFSIKTLSGQILNHQQADAIVRKNLQMMKTISQVDVKIVTFETENGQTIVVESQKITATLADNEGREHALIDLSKSRDTWVQVEGQWKVKFSEFLEDSPMIDGKSIH
jgi:hypothetical protein